MLVCKKEIHLNGVLLIDKPSGITSHNVVDRVRKTLGMRLIGHAGTLDPLATGLMVILVGQCTKLSDYLLNEDKAYEFSVQLGLETDSWDIDGKILKDEKVFLDKEKIEEEALKLQGDLNFGVPSFSAVKINGTKLYDYARKENEFKNPKRIMSFFNLKILETGEDFLRVRLACKKGGYIRSWAYELGKNLDVGGTIKTLRRISSKPYKINQSIKLDEFENLEAADKLKGLHFIPLSECLPSWKNLTVKGKEERLMSNGQIPHSLLKRLNFEQKQVNNSQQNMRVKVTGTSQLISLLELQPFDKPKVCRVFNL